ncbi:MAG: metal-dependent hydrolase, partial [Pseudomonadota bacterium]
MTQSNHIAGGTVFTGIFASLWDINVFSDINLLLICWFSSILPDIDHTKSTIGKIFYPVAKYLDKKFGHRTITHSIIFAVSTWLIIKVILPPSFALVYILGICSHLIFDMMTVQGVPLLYPFKKNPCVIPGNPEARIRSGNIRAELTAFVLFIVCGVFCYPLMSNGFWMTFNRTLGSKK